MRQILYVSTSTSPGNSLDVPAILEQSRHNNALDGVTGLLWADEYHYMQVLEGPDDSVATTLARISSDPRHTDLRLLQDREITDREFGYWTMTHRQKGEAADSFNAHVRRLLAGASDPISEHFLSIVSGT